MGIPSLTGSPQLPATGMVKSAGSNTRFSFFEIENVFVFWKNPEDSTDFEKNT